jgi:hypothetical protein
VIDPAWLRQTLEYSEADPAGHDPEHLARLLEDPAEVLPYLMTRVRGFERWPKARAALAKGASGTPKSRPGGAIWREANLSAHRAELYEVLREALVDSAARHPWRPEAPRPTEDLLNLIKRIRFEEARGGDSPSLFITAARD